MWFDATRGTDDQQRAPRGRKGRLGTVAIPHPDSRLMPTIACPACGGADDLVGRDTEDGRVIDCQACGHRWRRDLTLSCQLCGSTDLEPVLTSTLEEAGRGDQRTPSGIRAAYRCYGCGARDATSSSPVAAAEAPSRTSPLPPAVPAGRTGPGDGDLDPAAGRGGEAPRVTSVFGTFEVGAVVGGRWELTGLLEVSSSGTIWAAREHDGDRRVVFKLLDPRITGPLAASHATSARAVAAIRHPNLLRLLDVRARDGQVLIVAEHVPGPTLEHQPAPPARRLAAAAVGLSDAVVSLHANRLAHLDIRPAKVLTPEERPATLIDLGSGRVRARLAEQGGTEARMIWAAPEQIVERAHGPAADVYRLGFTLWIAAGGDVTSLGVNGPAQAAFRLGHDLPRLDDAVGQPAWFVDAIAAATRRRPDQRPSAPQLSAMLRRGARGGAV